MKKSWLLNFENKYRMKKTAKTKKVKVKPKRDATEVDDSHGCDHPDDTSSASFLSTTSSVVSMVAAREMKRGHKIIRFVEKGNVIECGAGSPGGHIARQLNRENPVSVNINKDTAINLYGVVSDGDLLSYSSKRVVTKDDGPQWDQRIYTSACLFDNITPRFGGVSNRRDAKHKPSVRRHFVVRDSVTDSVTRVHNVDNPDTGNTSSRMLFSSLLTELHSLGASITTEDLSLLACVRNPPPYVDPVFSYIYILIMGCLPEDEDGSPSKPLRSPRHETGAATARKTLLKEPGSVLQYLKQIHPANIPQEHIPKAIEFFKSRVAIYPSDEIARLSRAFTKLVQWTVIMHKLCQCIAHSEYDKDSVDATEQQAGKSGVVESPNATETSAGLTTVEDGAQLQDV